MPVATDVDDVLDALRRGDAAARDRRLRRRPAARHRVARPGRARRVRRGRDARGPARQPRARRRGPLQRARAVRHRGARGLPGRPRRPARTPPSRCSRAGSRSPAADPSEEGVPCLGASRCSRPRRCWWSRRSACATADPGSATGRVAAGVACLPGARTLSHHGDHVYPDMGNGGYRSLHTEVHLVYDAPSNRFLRGNHVVLIDRATQCLSELSLDFERTSVLGRPGPDLTVRAVRVDGRPRVVPLRPAHLPRRPERSGRPGPARAPGLPGHARSADPTTTRSRRPATPQVTGSDVNAQDGQPCPAEQAGDHAAAAVAEGTRLPREGRLHRPARRAPRRRRHDRGLVPLRTTRRGTAASSPPSRSAPRTGCR